ncbi:unnamed protein product [Cuscuta campestris]|uniref:COI1 F-box domain-containing protein n=1 Tax=Cuscuta campestris TaxID=132261 RepID=A0A484N4W7_9ASTE|nr:unnamed protein product [Cuscuta campestris]
MARKECSSPTEVPSLFNLCSGVIKDVLCGGDFDLIAGVYQLPSELFQPLLPLLPPLALQRLQEQMPFDFGDDHGSVPNNYDNDIPRKRRRHVSFQKVWETLYKARWPDCDNKYRHGQIWSLHNLIKRKEPKHEFTHDWQQIYWETHLQTCLDAAAEIALLPSFEGHIGEVKVPESILKHIGYREHFPASSHDPSMFTYHCQQFGLYACYLRLPSVLCVAETCYLLRNAKLQKLELRWIKSQNEEDVEGLCKLLKQNSGTLKSINFIYSKFSASSLNAICSSLCFNGLQTHDVQQFTIMASRFLSENVGSNLPTGLLLFLSSGRSLCSLSLSDSKLDQNCARMIFNTLLGALSSISILDLSENNISGWLSHFKWQSTSNMHLPLGMSNSLKSLRVLNLRNNGLRKDDVDCLRYVHIYMPNLDSLDLSDNPIEDEGVRSLVTYIEGTCKMIELRLENCELTFNGVNHLLECLSCLQNLPTSLSIGGNTLGSEIGAAIGKFLCKGILALDIDDIGLGSSGFSKAREQIVGVSKLRCIDISKNRGGIETANFMSKLFSHAPELLAINAGYNFMPAESLAIIGSGLEVANGKVEFLDLSGNVSCRNSADVSVLAKFEVGGKLVLEWPSSAPNVPYDDDP